MRPAEKKDLAAIQEIYEEAFPPEERAPFSWLTKPLARGDASLLVHEQDGRLAGFAYCVQSDKLLYLFYLAVHHDFRQSGIGSGMVQEVLAGNPDKTVFLARERLDEPCDNLEERCRRRDFYLKNGLVDVPMLIREGPCTFDVMTDGGSVQPEQYRSLMEAWFGHALPASVPVGMEYRP